MIHPILKTALLPLTLALLLTACDTTEVEEESPDSDGVTTGSAEQPVDAGEPVAAADENTPPDDVYDFTMLSIEGEPVKLSQYRGKTALVVNVASKCGFTKQYTGLQAIYEKYKDKGFVVLGFPANNFGKQEPGTNQEIQTFCTENYSVTFPMFAKISVKGDDKDPLYTYLTEESGDEYHGDIKWNFNKFLVGPDGKVIARFDSNVTPQSEELVALIEQNAS